MQRKTHQPILLKVNLPRHIVQSSLTRRVQDTRPALLGELTASQIATHRDKLGRRRSARLRRGLQRRIKRLKQHQRAEHIYLVDVAQRVRRAVSRGQHLGHSTGAGDQRVDVHRQGVGGQRGADIGKGGVGVPGRRGAEGRQGADVELGGGMGRGKGG